MSGAQLTGARVDGAEMLLTFEVGQPAREATVLVSARGVVNFPHLRGESGESLGSAEQDAALLDRARAIVAFARVAEAWGALRRRQR